MKHFAYWRRSEPGRNWQFNRFCERTPHPAQRITGPAVSPIGAWRDGALHTEQASRRRP
jgi:hypothetical protein